MQLLLLHLSIAFAAIYGSVVAGLERNLSFLAASCTGSGEKLSLRLSGVLSCVTAGLASLRLVLEALLCIELLLASGEYKLFAAILTDQFFILIHLKIPRLCRKNNICPRRIQTDTFASKITTNALFKLYGHMLLNCFKKTAKY